MIGHVQYQLDYPGGNDRNITLNWWFGVSCCHFFRFWIEKLAMAAAMQWIATLKVASLKVIYRKKRSKCQIKICYCLEYGFLSGLLKACRFYASLEIRQMDAYLS